MGIFFIESVKLYTISNIWLFWVAFFLSIGFLIALTCCGDFRRKTPHNMILLVGFTLTEGLMLGVATSTYSADAVLMGKIYKSWYIPGSIKIICLNVIIDCWNQLITKYSFNSCWDNRIGGFGPDHLCFPNQDRFHDV